MIHMVEPHKKPQAHETLGNMQKREGKPSQEGKVHKKSRIEPPLVTKIDSWDGDSWDALGLPLVNELYQTLCLTSSCMPVEGGPLYHQNHKLIQNNCRSDWFLGYKTGAYVCQPNLVTLLKKALSRKNYQMGEKQQDDILLTLVDTLSASQPQLRED